MEAEIRPGVQESDIAAQLHDWQKLHAAGM